MPVAMADVIFVPRVKTAAATIESPISRCGDHWWRDVRIRSPYKGVDVAHRTLPSLGDPEQVESLDPEFLNEIEADRDRIAMFASEHSADLSDSQRASVELLMRRATAYLSDSKKIQDLWSSGFSTSSQGPVPPWPLHGLPKGPINSNIEEGHRRDSDKWKKLVRATLRNLRCAEEVAKKATIYQYNKNKRIYGRRFGTNIPSMDTGGNMKAMPSLPKFSTNKKFKVAIPGSPEPSLGTEFGPGEPPIPEEMFNPQASGEPELEPESLTEPAAPPRVHKKDSSLLLAGVAVLGVFALSKGKSR